MNSLKDFEGEAILLAKFGPIFVKYWQNLLAIISGLVISRPLSRSCIVDDAFLLFRLITLFKILHVCLMFSLLLSSWIS